MSGIKYYVTSSVELILCNSGEEILAVWKSADMGNFMFVLLTVLIYHQLDYRITPSYYRGKS